MAKARGEAAVRPLGNELAETLRAELLGWPAVEARLMMGTLAFFRGQRMLGCFVSRELIKKSPKPAWVNRLDEPPFVWVRLTLEDKTRALRRPGVREDWSERRREQEGKPRPSRLGFAGWVEIPLDSRDGLEEAVRWLGVAYEKTEKGNRKREKSR